MKFDIGTILSVAHSKLLTEIGNVYKILNFMLDDNLFTNQLPRAGRFCAKFLITQHLQLENWAEFDEQITPENYKEYLEKAKTMFGKELEISKVPSGVWSYKDPTDELKEHFAEENIIKVKF